MEHTEIPEPLPPSTKAAYSEHQSVPAPCGCINRASGAITFCPLHAAAPDLLTALKLALTTPGMIKGRAEAEAAIAKAEPELREARLAAIKDRLDNVAAKAIRAAQEKP